MADHVGNHRCLTENIVPIAFILPTGRWQDGAESHKLTMMVHTNFDECSK